MRNEQQIAEANRQIDEALAHGKKAAISWLRRAYHAHENQIERLRGDFDELRALFLACIRRPLSVREAQLLRVCRVCRGPNDPKAPGDPFVLKYGDEHAHQSCLDL